MKHFTAMFLAAALTAAPLAAQESPDLKEAFAKLAQTSQEKSTELKQSLSGEANDKALFTITKKDGKNLLELRQQQMERAYLLSGTLDRGTGEMGMFTDTFLGSFLVVFHWNGSKVEVVRRSATVRTKPGSAEAKARANSTADSILAILPVISSGTSGWTVSADQLFLTDLCNLHGAMVKGGAYADSSVSPDSSLQELTVFPKNAEAQVRLILTRPETAESQAMPDARRFSIAVHYSLSEVPGDPNFEQRPNDARVGYFTQTHVDYSRYDMRDRGLPITTAIERWNLQKVDPSAAVSDVKNPITFWMEDTIPEAYRPAIKAGILAWNSAFEAVGLRNAVVVKEVDKDMTPEQRATFNPADASYNVVRWFMGNGASFAEAPSRANPETGEIFNAGIRIGDPLLRAMTMEQNIAALPGSKKGAALDTKAAVADSDDFIQEAAMQATQALAVLEAQGVSAVEKTRFINEFLTYIAAHESGHTLGLRHNFKASSWLPQDQLGKDGMLTASVMDYVAPNIPAKGDAKAPYFQTKLGPYDYWAIEYGYKQIQGTDEEKRAQLKAIADRRQKDPSLAYGSDEEIHTIAGDSVDPDAQVWDLGKGAQANAQKHIDQARTLWQSLPAATEQTRTEDQPSLRRKFMYGFYEYHAAVANLAPVIGGVHVSRGSPGAGQDSYTPVSAAEQKQALRFLDENVFSDKPFQVDPAVMRRLGEENSSGLDGMNLPLNLNAQVANLRFDALKALYNPSTLSRLSSRRELVSDKSDQLGVYDVMGSVRASIWKEVEGATPSSISASRRTLQRMQLDILSQYAADPGQGDMRDAAFRDLKVIRADAKRALAAGRLDTPTRLHLQEVVMSVDNALSPKVAGK